MPNLSFKPVWADRLLAAYMLLAMALPFQLMASKLVLLAGFAALRGAAMIRNGDASRLLEQQREIFLGMEFVFLVGASFIILGLPHALHRSTFYVSFLYLLFPVAAFAFALMSAKLLTPERVINTLFTGAALISATIFYAVLVAFHMLPAFEMIKDGAPIPLIADRFQIFATTVGVIKVHHFGISPLTFLVPFSFAIFLTGVMSSQSLRNLMVPLAVLAATTAAVFLSGRIGATIGSVVGIAVASALCCWLYDSRRLGTVMVAIAVVGALSIGCIAASWLFSHPVGTGAETQAEKILHGGGQARVDQAQSLIRGIMESPIIGHGHGTGTEVVRNLNRPWQYELSYLALLYHVGLLGLACYAAAFGWIFLRGCQVVAQRTTMSPVMLGALAGLASVIVAHATNPYFDSFDMMWTIFLPVAIISRELARLPVVSPRWVSWVQPWMQVPQ